MSELKQFTAMERCWTISESTRARPAVHVLNAPSPGATSSLVIGNYIADRADTDFSL